MGVAGIAVAVDVPRHYHMVAGDAVACGAVVVASADIRHVRSHPSAADDAAEAGTVAAAADDDVAVAGGSCAAAGGVVVEAGDSSLAGGAVAVGAAVAAVVRQQHWQLHSASWLPGSGSPPSPGCC